MDKKVLNPIWGNKEMTHVICQIEDNNGNNVTASVTNTDEGEINNPDWDMIMDQHTVEAITENSEKHRGQRGPGMPDTMSPDQKHQVDAEQRKKQLNDVLFESKLQAFEIEEVKLSKNRALKSRIRKAKSVVEMNAFVSVIIMESLSAPAKKKPTKKKSAIIAKAK